MYKNEWHHFSCLIGMAKSTKKRTRLNELPDSPEDRRKMEPEDVTMDLPEVKDIPGQENIHPPDLKAFNDTTVSSADEEGKGIAGFEDDIELVDNETNVSKEEAALLERTADSQAGPEDLAWQQSSVDNTDEDGELLNEETEYSGKDLDIPGAEDDDMNEEIGEEDEENNSYSLGADKD